MAPRARDGLACVGVCAVVNTIRLIMLREHPRRQHTPSSLAALTVLNVRAAAPTHDTPPLSIASSADEDISETAAGQLPPSSTRATDMLELANPLRTRAFPVILLAQARPHYLNRTLHSLLRVRGVVSTNVFVVQDGTDSRVARLARKLGCRLVQRRKADIAAAQGDSRGGRIAHMYKYALSLAFDSLTQDEAIVVAEDDLLFSPDAMDFFLAGWAVMQVDPTVWCVSAWNDNGYSGMVREPKRLMRTQYFPGLGWLLSRKLYKGQLEAGWPNEHWDHWMRSETKYRTSGGRECIYPQVRNGCA